MRKTDSGDPLVGEMLVVVKLLFIILYSKQKKMKIFYKDKSVLKS